MNPKLLSEYLRTIRYMQSLENISGSYQKTDLSSHPNPALYLKRMQALLDAAGNPEKEFKYIHVTGTAGKGTVCSIIYSTILKNGKKAGLFTTPHTVTAIETVQVGEKYISPKDFVDITESLKPHIDSIAAAGRNGAPSYFEINLAIALIYFKRQNCEYVVLEVGLGGRYDATNVIKAPLVTAITNIDLDHTQVLGNNKSKIAYEKAGIIKSGSHFFTTETNTRLLAFFKSECVRKLAFYHECNKQEMTCADRNMLLANSICRHLGMTIPNTSNLPLKILPARFEIIDRNPLVIVDGAHNESKIRATVQNLKRETFKNLHLVIAIAADKKWRPILKLLLPITNSLYITRFSAAGRQCVPPQPMLDYVKRYAPGLRNIFFSTDAVRAYNYALESMADKDALLVTGSFYLAGEIRSLLCSEEEILTQRNCVISSSH